MLGLKIYGSGIRGLCVSWWVYEPLRGVLQGFIVSCWILQVSSQGSMKFYRGLQASQGFMRLGFVVLLMGFTGP